MNVIPNDNNSSSNSLIDYNALYSGLVKLYPPIDAKKLELYQYGGQFIVAHGFNTRFNRWNDVLPLDKNRFQIEGEEQFYFNATNLPDWNAIASQGPLPIEIAKFWHMIDKSEVCTIVMLTNLIERSRDKCSEYWICDKVKFTEAEIFADGDQKIIRREIEILDSKKRVVQFHLLNWPDYGTVSPVILSKLVKIVHAAGGKILTHCSAGLGRTGVFLTILRAFRENKSSIGAIVDLVGKLRQERWGSVQSGEQLALAHQTTERLLQETSSANQNDLQ